MKKIIISIVSILLVTVIVVYQQTEKSQQHLKKLHEDVKQMLDDFDQNFSQEPNILKVKEEISALLEEYDISTIESKLKQYELLLKQNDDFKKIVTEFENTVKLVKQEVKQDPRITKIYNEINQLIQEKDMDGLKSKINEYKETLELAATIKRKIDVESTDDFKIIVNKKHPLPKSYDPGENSVAKNAFLVLLSDMKQLGYKVSDDYSGYRSYQTQKELYENYVNRDGQENADRYSARPGFSEHQTGLAFDLIGLDGLLLGQGEDDGGATWLSQNAHLYGFVVRYQPDKEAITGYMGESWHIRFVGNDAINIYQSGLSLEEFYNVEGGDYIE